MDNIIILIIALSGIPISRISMKGFLSNLLVYREYLSTELEITAYEECSCPECSGKTNDEIIKAAYKIFSDTKKRLLEKTFSSLFVFIFYCSVTILSIHHLI